MAVEGLHLVLSFAARDMDLRNTVKNGVLYLEDPVDKEWYPHFFVLTQHKLFYTDTFQGNQDGDEDGEAEETPAGPVSQSRLREVRSFIQVLISISSWKFTYSHDGYLLIHLKKT